MKLWLDSEGLLSRSSWHRELDDVLLLGSLEDKACVL